MMIRNEAKQERYVVALEAPINKEEYNSLKEDV